MSTEKDLVYKEFEAENRVFITPLSLLLDNDPAVTGEIEPVTTRTGTIKRKERYPFDGYYIVDLDAPVFYISGSERVVKRLESIRESWGNMELNYDRPSLDEIK